ALLERAAAASPDDFFPHYHLGVTRLRRLEKNGSIATASAADWEKTRTPLARAVELQAESPAALAALGHVEARESARLFTARDRLVQAVRLAPSRETYKLVLVDILIRLDDFTTARKFLTPLATAGSSEEIRKQAQTMITQLSHEEAARQAERKAHE